MSVRIPTRAVVLALAAVCTAIPAAALAAPTAPTAVGVAITGKTSLATVQSPTVLIDTGTVQGSPVGSGNITLTYRLLPNRGVAVTTFTITNANGTVTGRCQSDYAVTRLHITFTGAAQITGGTGAYAGIRGRPLQFNAIHSITGKKEAIALTGRATTRRNKHHTG